MHPISILTVDLKLYKGSRDQKEGQKDRLTDRQTNGQTDGWTNCNIDTHFNVRLDKFWVGQMSGRTNVAFSNEVGQMSGRTNVHVRQMSCLYTGRTNVAILALGRSNVNVS